MKIGDKIVHTTHRPDETAVIKEVNIHITETSVQSSYTAFYEDGEKLIFYGFNINKTIFLYTEANKDYEQLTIDLYLKQKGKER